MAEMRSIFVTGLFVLAITLLACGGGSENGAANDVPTSAPTATIVVPDDNRIRVPRFGIDAPLGLKAVGRDGNLPNTDGPDDVAIYDFAAFPGLGGMPGQGNAVMAGNLDSGARPCRNGSIPPPCEAVFWDLSRLNVGDEVQIFWERKPFIYKVVSRCWIETTDASEAIYTSTDRPSVTLITAAGAFRQGQGYSHRIVIKAELDSTGAASCVGSSATPPAVPSPAPRP